MVVGQRCSDAHTQYKHTARGSVDRSRGRDNVYPWDTNKQQHLTAAAAAAVELTTSTYLIPMRDHCAMSSHSAYALCVCVHCAAVRLSFARNLSTACQSTRHTPWLPDWETDSRKAGKLDSRQFWPLFAAVKLCQTSFKSGEAAKTAPKMQPNENLSAKNSFGQGIYCGATGWSNVTTSHSSSQRQHTHIHSHTHTCNHSNSIRS